MRLRRSLGSIISIHQFNLTRSPGLVNPGLQRAIHSPGHKPGFTWNGLQPIAFLTLGRYRAEIDIDGAISIGFHALLVAVQGRELLVGLQLAAGLGVVHRQCPEVLDRDIFRQVQFIGLGTI